MQPTDCNDMDRDALHNNRCPDCGNYGFHDGPRGGASINIFCCNPHCRSGFNVGPIIGPRLITAQRIGRGPLAFYAPQTHAVISAPSGLLPVCAFTLRRPEDWPRGHQPAGGLSPVVTCPECQLGMSRRRK